MTIQTNKTKTGLYMVTISQGVDSISIVDKSRSTAFKIALKYIHDEMGRARLRLNVVACNG